MNFRRALLAVFCWLAIFASPISAQLPPLVPTLEEVEAAASDPLPRTFEEARYPDLRAIRALLEAGHFLEARTRVEDLLSEVLAPEDIERPVWHRLGADASAADWARFVGLLELAVEIRLRTLWLPGDPSEQGPVYNDALLRAFRAVEIRDRQVGKDAGDLSFLHMEGSFFDPRSRSLLAEVLFASGAFEESQRYWRQVILTLEQLRGQNDSRLTPNRTPNRTQIYINAGRAFQATGDLATARELMQVGLMERVDANALDQQQTVIGFSRLGAVFVEMGDGDAAREAYEWSLSLAESYFGPFHENIIYGINGLLRLELNRFQEINWISRTESERVYRLLDRLLVLNEAMDVNRTLARPTFFEAHVERLSLGAMCSLLFAEESVEEQNAAIAMARLAVDLAWAVGGSKSPHLSKTIEVVADLHLRVGDLSGALEALEEQRRFLETENSSVGREFGWNLVNLGNVRYGLEDDTNALLDSLNGVASIREALRATIHGLTEDASLGLWDAWSSQGLDLALTIVEGAPDQGAVSRVADAIIQHRAVIFDEMAARHYLANRNDDQGLSALYEEVIEARQRLARVVVGAVAQTSTEYYDRVLNEARQAKTRAEEALSGRSATFRRYEEQQGIDLQDVNEALPPDTALVSFVRYQKRLMRGPASPGSQGFRLRRNVLPPSSTTVVSREVASYLALIQRFDTEDILLVPLGPAEEIDLSVERWRSAASFLPEGNDSLAASRRPTQGDVETYRAIGNRLRTQVWDPLTSAFSDLKRVLIVPDGALSLVNFSALPVGDDRYLVEEDLLIHLLSTEREVVRFVEARKSSEGLLAMGAPAFDEQPVTARIPSPETIDLSSVQDLDSTLQPTAFRFPSRRSACQEFASMNFGSLPGTGAEVDRIVALWRGSDELPEGDVVRLVGTFAREEAFKREAPGKRVLHLATHGFFLRDECGSVLGQRAETLHQLLGGGRMLNPEEGESPMLLSGLVLAAANNRSVAGPESEDGIVTAEEIASLDLTGVEWAVLSACDTGLGTVRAGEGVFGLRRAFQVAGVHTVIMSLWSVDDEATRQWMEELYQARLLEGLGTASAVRQASLHVLNQLRDQGAAAHPFFWAPFIATGNWN